MRRSGGVSGAVSLVMIFCVLCLAVFAVLTLATADREARLSEMTARSAADYFSADFDATAIVAALRNGSLSEGADVEITWEGDTASFLFPVSDSLGLDVAVSVRDGECEILRWQTVYTGSWEPDRYLKLWNGT